MTGAPGPAPSARELLDRIREVIQPAIKAAAVHEPLFRGREKEYLADCVDTGFVSSVGPYVDRFEAMLAEITGVGRAVAVVNGTAALHICLLLCDVSRDDEVLIPSLTFVATANAVAYCGAVPHFVDVEERTLGVDAHRLEAYLGNVAVRDGGGCRNRETGRRIKALMPMHAFGIPADLDALQGVCSAFGLALIEDAAEALGTRYKGGHVGRHGRMSALSFNGNKIVTTGGGGAVLTDDDGLGRLAKHVTTTAKAPHRWAFNHDRIGYNYRMPNINAALGCAQLEQLPDFLARKRKLARAYRDVFSGTAGARIVEEPEFAESNCWLNVLLIENADSGLRDAVLDLGLAEGIALRPAWTPMHRLPMYAQCPRAPLEVTESLELRLINLPSGAGLSDGK